uniref:RWD domain-containing protein n=1 Tax=Romanomermis culicivorax TaxID=13658 RepID=A0A915KH68_ROMCU
MFVLCEEYKEILRQSAEMKNQELELLGSMYNVPDELEFLTLAVVSTSSSDENCEISNRCNSSTVGKAPSESDFTLKLKFNNFDVELTFHLPVMYPISEKLRIFLRCNNINNNFCVDLNKNLRIFVGNLTLGEPQINACVDFVRSKFEKLEKRVDQMYNGEFSLRNDIVRKITRFWIYSHHIYSKIKRRNIKNLTDRLNLNGFCLPGKPAVICVQGLEANCRQFWGEIKLWSWKKIALKREEEICIDDESHVFQRKKLFENFSEIQMDIKEFKLLLESYDSRSIFNVLFGLGE